MLSLSCRPDLCCSNSRDSTPRGPLMSHSARSNCCHTVHNPRQCSSSSPARNDPSTSISTISSRSAVVCHDGRPMWARGTPEPDDGNRGGGVSAIITKEITKCDSIPELETVFIEHSSSFNHINASAALVKYAKLRGSSIRSPFFGNLAAAWLQQLPEATTRQCGNVLWACSKLGSASAKHPVWAQTWQAFLDLIGKELSGSQTPLVRPQELSNSLYACAKLQQQLNPDDLLLLLEAFLHPTVVAAAVPQAVANVIWSLGWLGKELPWEAEVSQQMLQRLLAPQMLTMVAEGTGQDASNVLVALSRMCMGSSPLLSVAATQAYAGQLLAGVNLNRVPSWESQQINNSLWALGELQLKDDRFIRAAVAAAPKWLPNANPRQVSQAATACAQLQYRDEHFMELLLQRAQQLLQPSWSKGSRSQVEADKASLIAQLSISVVLLDMRRYAGAARKLVADFNFVEQSGTHPSNLRRLWLFHSWLLEHQLLDGKGLAGLVTKQQLQQGAKEAAEWGDKTRL